MKKTNILLFIGLIAVVALSGCAHTIPVNDCIPATEHVYGFWAGTWHGFISFFSFIGSLFDDSIAIYAVNNNGHWYDFGFVGGFFIILHIIASIIKKSNK